MFSLTIHFIVVEGEVREGEEEIMFTLTIQEGEKGKRREGRTRGVKEGKRGEERVQWGRGDGQCGGKKRWIG